MKRLRGSRSLRRLAALEEGDTEVAELCSPRRRWNPKAQSLGPRPRGPGPDDAAALHVVLLQAWSRRIYEETLVSEVETPESPNSHAAAGFFIFLLSMFHLI